MKYYFVVLAFLITNLYAQTPRLMAPIGHNDAITDVAFSKNGKFLVTASEDRTVKIWDAKTGKLLQNFTNFNSKVLGADFSSNNQNIIACSEDGFFYEWDIYTGQITNKMQNTDERMSKCVYSPNGKLIAIAYNYKYRDTCDIIIYDKQQKKILNKINAHKQKIHKLIFSPNGKTIVSASYDNMLKIWDINSGKLVAEKNVSTPDDLFIYSLGFVPNDTKIYTCNPDGELIFYDANTLKQLQKVKNDTIRFSYANYSSDGRRIAVGANSGKFYILDATNFSVVKRFRSDDANEQYTAINIIKFNSDDKRLLAISGIVGYGTMYDIDDEKPSFKLTGMATKVFSAKFSPHSVLFITSNGDNTAKIWNTNTGKLLGVLSNHQSHVTSATFSSDAKFVATASLDETVKIWDWSKILVLKTIKLGKTGDYNVEMDKSNKKILVCSYADTTAFVYNIDDGKLLYKLIGHNDYVLFATFSPDGKTIATASRDNTVKLWNAEDGSLITTFIGHESWVTSVKFSWNNYFLVSASYDSTVKIWNLKSNTCYSTLKHPTQQVNYADFGAQPKYIVTAADDKKARIWDATTQKCLFVLEGHSDNMTSAEFDSKGERVITTSEDKTCKLWDAKTGKLIMTFIALGKTDYIAINSENYYQCSPNAAKMLYYVTKDLKTVSFDQLDLKYNRPDKVLQTLNNKDTVLINASKNAYNKRIKKLGIDTSYFTNEYSVPTTEIINANKIVYQQNTDKLLLKIHASDNDIYLNKFNIWINETPLFGMKGISLGNRNIKTFDTVVTVTLSAQINNIEASVINKNGTESYRSPLVVKYSNNTVKPKVHFIGIGINQFKEPDHNLNWSVKDIRDLTQKMKEKYGEVLIVDTLFDEKVSVENILSIKQKLKKLSVDDIVILAYSGHGMLNKEFDYYLSTYNVNFNNPENGGLLYDKLESLFDEIAPRKKLMLIDACHSGEVDKEDLVMAEQAKNELEKNGIKGVSLKTRPTKKAGSKNTFEIMQSYFANVSRTTGTTVISAAAGTQYALEKGDLKNGVFTYCVINAMNTFKTLTVQNLKRYVTAQVIKLTNGLQKPTSRTENNTTDWNVW